MDQRVNSYKRATASPSSSTIRWTRIVLTLLFLTALGQLFGNISLFRLAGFAATIPYFLFGLVAILTTLSPHLRTTSTGIIVPLWLFMILWEFLFHAVVLGSIKDVDWQRSAAQYGYLSLCFVLASRLHVDRSDIQKMLPLLRILAMLFGGFGILQFILSNVGKILVILPSSWSASSWDPTLDIYRTGGLYRAAGISREPSAYALGLSLTFALMLFVNELEPTARNKSLLGLPLLLLVGGSVVSFSFAGWFLGVGVLLVALFVGRVSAQVRFGIIAFFSLLFLLYWWQWPPEIMERLTLILEGTDRSLLVRGISPLRLFLAPSRDFVDFMIGRGIGQEENYRLLIEQTYLSKYTSTSVHNTFALIRITQGWAGLALHLLLLVATVHRSEEGHTKLYVPLLATFFLFHFFAGLYLSPVYWGFLALLRVLRQAKLDALQAEQVRMPMDGP